MTEGTDDLIEQLTGFDSPEEKTTISTLISEGDDGLVERLQQELGKSHWPVCNSFATALGRIGSQAAKDALVRNLGARRRHIRTVAINGLVLTGDASRAAHIKALVMDPAHETRETAKEAIRTLASQASARASLNSLPTATTLMLDMSQSPCPM